MIRICAFLLTLLSVGLCQASPAQPIALDQFAEFPVLHDGRIKPLDTLARIELLKFSGKEKNGDQSPIQWLTESLFDPAQSVDQKIFLIESAVTRHHLGLEERKKPLYSYSELVGGLEKTSKLVGEWINIPQKQLNKEQKDILSVHENALEYTYLLRSFSPVLPLNIDLPKTWRQKAGLQENDPVRFLALKKISPDIEDHVKKIIRKKGEDPAKYTPDEQNLVALGWQYQTLLSAGQNNKLFRVIPTGVSEEWASLWELMNDGKGNPETSHRILDWSDLASAWQDQNADQWNKAIGHLKSDYQYKDFRDVNFNKLWLEVQYNRASPFFLSIIFFSAAMVIGLFSFIGKQDDQGGAQGLSYKLAFVSLLLAIVIQFSGLAIRVYLMERPPVGTLYESILFVGLIAPLVSFFVETKLRGGLGLIAGGVSGAMLGLLAISLAGDGDNMKVLGAVLNTRFWLTTHVLCITIGYGWCLLTSVLAHILLIGKWTGKLADSRQGQLIRTMTTHSLFSLFFTTVGTILGGIWADQSWGRFWGWDPKENGALLIVLWLIWLIHGKIAGQISQNIWIGGLAFLSVIVGIAWVGVNLLGVGLHSYGFIEGVFWGLGLFALAELCVIGGIIFSLKRKDATPNAA